MTVADPADAVLPPTIRARTRVIVREKLPGRAPGTVILTDRSPLPLGKIRPPALPVLLSNARFLEAAVFRGLDSWHDWTALRRKFQAIVAFLAENSSVEVGARACSGKPRRRQIDLMHRMRETAIWVRVFYEKIAIDKVLASADLAAKRQRQVIRCTLGGACKASIESRTILRRLACSHPTATP